MTIPEFGSFKRIFQEDGLFLGLLNLHSPDTAMALAAVKEAVSKNPNVEKELLSFLDDHNWRFHLVAAVATAFFKPSNNFILKLWGSLDRESWVSPQIGAVLSLCDPDFQAQALIRLKKYCQVVNQSSFPSLLHKHIESSTLNNAERPSKAALSLISLLRRCKEADVQTTILSAAVRAMVRSDIDGERRIAKGWLESYMKSVKELE